MRPASLQDLHLEDLVRPPLLAPAHPPALRSVAPVRVGAGVDDVRLRWQRRRDGRVRRRRFHHYTLGGELAIEDEDVLEQETERVTCRWCDRSDGIETVTIDEEA